MECPHYVTIYLSSFFAFIYFLYESWQCLCKKSKVLQKRHLSCMWSIWHSLNKSFHAPTSVIPEGWARRKPWALLWWPKNKWIKKRQCKEPTLQKFLLFFMRNFHWYLKHNPCCALRNSSWQRPREKGNI